jgi:hypothetical protein
LPGRCGDHLSRMKRGQRAAAPGKEGSERKTWRKRCAVSSTIGPLLFILHPS